MKPSRLVDFEYGFYLIVIKIPSLVGILHRISLSTWEILSANKFSKSSRKIGLEVLQVFWKWSCIMFFYAWRVIDPIIWAIFREIEVISSPSHGDVIWMNFVLKSMVVNYYSLLIFVSIQFSSSLLFIEADNNTLFFMIRICSIFFSINTQQFHFIQRKLQIQLIKTNGLL